MPSQFNNLVVSLTPMQTKIVNEINKVVTNNWTLKRTKPKPTVKFLARLLDISPETIRCHLKAITAKTRLTKTQLITLIEGDLMENAVEFKKSDELQELLRINADGTVTKNGVLIEGDEEFKKAMVELNEQLKLNLNRGGLKMLPSSTVANLTDKYYYNNAQLINEVTVELAKLNELSLIP